MKILKAVPVVVIAGVIISGCIKQTEPKNLNEKVNKRIGSLIKVRPEFEERYVILHKHTFPAVLESIKKCNIRNYSIFLLDGTLFSHYEYIGQNYDADMKAIGDETTKEWWKLTDPMQEPLSTRKEGEWWAGMDLLYGSDFKVRAYTEAKRFAKVAEIADGQEEILKNEIQNTKSINLDPLEKYNFQNFNFYVKDGRIYLYYEYAGRDLNRDQADWNKNEEIASQLGRLNKHLKSVWMPMKEVFHTN